LLCEQLMFARASEERPAVYLSTVSEPFEKILRYAQTLSFFAGATSAQGVTVFPPLADPIRDDDYRLGEERISSGIAPLDRCAPRVTRRGAPPRWPDRRVPARH
jgi:circadian clock protein KaiC